MITAEQIARTRARNEGARAGGVVYRGHAGTYGMRVTVERGGVERALRHHVRHSPCGFAWGYVGAGPAELARCILIDFFGLHRTAMRHPRGLDLADYQGFKFDVVAKLARWDGRPSREDGVVWELTGAQIDDWIECHR